MKILRLIQIVAGLSLFAADGLPQDAADGAQGELLLYHSTDKENWEAMELTPDMLSPEGRIILEGMPQPVYFRVGVEAFERDPPPEPVDPPAEDMVLVQGGTLPDLSGLGELNVQTFYIGRYEVTWGKWKVVRDWAAANGYDIGNIGAGCADNHPVRAVNWWDTVKWCNAWSEMTGRSPVYWLGDEVFRAGQNYTLTRDAEADGYRLPSEREWEFAARGGIHSQGYLYSGSNILDEVGWFRDNSLGAPCDLSETRGTWPVGMKQPNELGLYDMSGNVREWCGDMHGVSHRRTRGGAWIVISHGSLLSTRPAAPSEAWQRLDGSGFRVARNAGD